MYYTIISSWVSCHIINYSLKVLTVTQYTEFEIRFSAVERHRAARSCVMLATVNLNNVFLPKSTPSFCTRTYTSDITTLGKDVSMCVCVCIEKQYTVCYKLTKSDRFSAARYLYQRNDKITKVHYTCIVLRYFTLLVELK
ncbi:unnamed protein product [Aphis gossypii]|uniref:Uncharacterized protein n=1 Tax=Aphis gossypii TaxID=80765 RepID=A0A9P0NI44_APHGO|nr:unnamed protein product [Aphis gossypii]